MLLLWLPGATPAWAQLDESSIGIWDVPRAKMDALLEAAPHSDADRYDRLRRAFVDFQCGGEALREIPVGKAPTERNLLCILPGEDRRPIVIAADWATPTEPADSSTVWPDAIALPMLYHAMRAAHHHFTFIFMALDGRRGEENFLRALRDGKFAQPAAFVDLAGLGLGGIRFSIAAPGRKSIERDPTARLLSRIAERLAGLQGLGKTGGLSAAAPSAAPRNSLYEGTEDLPRVLFFSDFTSAVSTESYHRQFDFIAFYLGAVDKQLNPMAQLPE